MSKVKSIILLCQVKYNKVFFGKCKKLFLPFFSIDKHIGTSTKENAECYLGKEGVYNYFLTYRIKKVDRYIYIYFLKYRADVAVLIGPC